MSDIRLVVHGEEEAKKGLERRQAAVRKSMLASLRLSAEVVYRRAAENVSGKVLKVQTGTLRRRLSTQVFADDLTARVGSPTVYAPVHEYGATIQHPGGTAYYFDERLDRTVFISNAAAARQGTKHAFPRTKPHPITIPARPWLRPALADSKKDIQAIFARGAQEALDNLGAAPA